MANEKPKKEEVQGDFPDEESKKIAQEIEDEKTGAADEEGQEEDDKKSEKTEKKESEKEDADQEDEDDQDDSQGEDDDQEDNSEEDDDSTKGQDEKPKKRTPRLMPIYKHKIEVDKWEKEKGTLQAEIDKLKTDTTADKHDDKPEEADQKIKEFAEEYGYDEKFVKGLLALMPKPKADISPELQKKLDALEQEKNEQFQERQFTQEYQQEVLPLIKAAGISENKYDEVLKLVKELAFTEQYAATPLKVIFKGVDDFDKFKSKKGKKSFESSKGGARGEESEVDLLDMSDEEFEKATDKLGEQGTKRTYSVPQKVKK